jgi:hypothetical protein
MALEQTTDVGLVAASALYRLDWDQEGTVSVHLPLRVAQKALRDRGWRIVTFGEVPRSERPRSRRAPVDPDAFHSVVAPTGERFWHLDEALQLALSAEVL